MNKKLTLVAINTKDLGCAVYINDMKTIMLNKGQKRPKHYSRNHLYFIGEGHIQPNEWYVKHRNTLHLNDTGEVIADSNSQKVHYSTDKRINNYTIDSVSMEMFFNSFSSPDLPCEVITWIGNYFGKEDMSVGFKLPSRLFTKNEVIRAIHDAIELDKSEIEFYIFNNL